MKDLQVSRRGAAQCPNVVEGSEETDEFGNCDSQEVYGKCTRKHHNSSDEVIIKKLVKSTMKLTVLKLEEKSY